MGDSRQVGGAALSARAAAPGAQLLASNLDPSREEDAGSVFVSVVVAGQVCVGMCWYVLSSSMS